MNFYLSYKLLNIPKDKLYADINPIMEILKKYGNVYCKLYDDSFEITDECEFEFEHEKISRVLDNLDKSNYLITYSDDGIDTLMYNLSEYAIHMHIPKLLLEKRGVEFESIHSYVDDIIVYDDLNDLLTKLDNYFIASPTYPELMCRR